MEKTVENSHWFESDLIRTDNDSDASMISKFQQKFDKYAFVFEQNSLNNEEVQNEYLSTERFEVSDDEFVFDYLDKKNLESYYHIGNSTYAEEHSKMKGFIVSIEDDVFHARIFDDGNHNGTYEMVEFDKMDVSEDDKDLFKIGAVFYWIFGRFFVNRQVKKISEIRFQRIAPLHPQEFDNIIEKADELNQNINWD